MPSGMKRDVPSLAATLMPPFCGLSAAGAGKIGMSAMKAINAPSETAWVNVLVAMSPRSPNRSPWCGRGAYAKPYNVDVLTGRIVHFFFESPVGDTSQRQRQKADLMRQR